MVIEGGEMGIDYKQRLDNVRHLPQNTKEEIKIKKDAAQNIRMSTYLEWAHFINKLAKDTLNGSKTETLNKRLSTDKNTLVHPDLADKLIRSIEFNKSYVLEAYQKIGRKTGLRINSMADIHKFKDGERSKLGSKVFEGVTGKIPQGGVVVFENPLAVSISVENPEDLKLLDNRANIGGDYRRWQTTKDGGFPFIFIKGGFGEAFRYRHEYGHAINIAIIDAFKMGQPTTKDDIDSDANLKSRWGGRNYSIMPEKPIKTKNDLVEFFSKNDFFSQAKNELLADYFVNQDLEYVEYLDKKEDIYDYGLKLIGELKRRSLINLPEEDVEIALSDNWKKYTEELSHQVEPMKEIIKIYKELGLLRKKELFGYVLAQVPLSKWKTIIWKDFYPEAAFYKDVRQKAIEIQQNLLLKVKNRKITEDDQSKKKVIIDKALVNLYEFAQTNSTQPLFEEIKKLDDLLINIEN